MSHKLTALQSQRISAGYTIGQLSKRANVSDWCIRTTENGGTITPLESQRIADALGVTLVSLGQKDIN